MTLSSRDRLQSRADNNSGARLKRRTRGIMQESKYDWPTIAKNPSEKEPVPWKRSLSLGKGACPLEKEPVPWRKEPVPWRKEPVPNVINIKQ
jgi:hypothetical protein